MFQFSGSTFIKLCIHSMITSFALVGFPHSEIHGSMDICSSPWLIAACHVLLRLLMPRHSPCALYSLTFRINLADSQLNYAGNLYRICFRNCNCYPSIRCSTIKTIFKLFRTIRSKDLSVALLITFFVILFSFQGAVPA